MNRPARLMFLSLGILSAPSFGAPSGVSFGARDGFSKIGTHTGPQSVELRTGHGRRVFVVTDPGARTSPASRIDPAGVSKDGRALSAEPGFTLFNEFVVRTRTSRPLDELLGAGLIESYEPIDGVPGAWRARASSVNEAIELSSLVRGDVRITGAHVAVERPMVLRSLPTDPLFEDQWHLENTVNPTYDVNADGAWSLGYNGSGVVVGIVENMWEHAHADLAAGFNALATQPGGPVGPSNHATSVAGVVGARAFNGQGCSGMAYACEMSNQYIGSDAQNASALGYANDINDIKNNSWGPPDTGYLHWISQVEYDAIEGGVQNGRGGLGVVYVWAAGNGGVVDWVDLDPFASSRYTMAIGAITNNDVRAGYNEKGSSMFAVAHSSGGSLGITTTQTGSDYTDSFGGTSSACPLVSGVVACMLEANPGLTWRDVQHIIADTTRMNHPASAGWIQNAAGRWHSYDYGFGAVDAGAAVAAAMTWDNVALEQTADSGVVPVNVVLPDQNTTGETRTVEILDDIVIESVELILNVDTDQVGDVRVLLTSPGGTESLLKKPNFLDGQDDLVDYRFTTVRNWGESSAGTWTVKLADEFPTDLATWIDFRIVAYGTLNIPDCAGDLTTTGAMSGQPEHGQPDGVTNLSDLLFYVGLWEADLGASPGSDADVTTTGTGFGDANFGVPDGMVDLSDLLFFVNEWQVGLGECP